jgi:hypothetical protein
MARWIGIVAIASLAMGCKSGDTRVLQAKCDPALRQAISDMARSGQPEVLPVMGNCSSSIDEAMRGRLAKAGAEVQAVTGAIFAARIPGARIAGVARLKFVNRLELSKTSNPSAP